MNIIDFDDDVKFDIEKESEDALIAAVARGFTVQAWMTALGTGKKVEGSLCAPNEAWKELLRRSNLVKDLCKPKTFVTECMKNRLFSISPEKMTCTSGDKVTEMIVSGGFIIPKAKESSNETKAAIANEVAIESMLFAIDSDPNQKRNAITTVDPVEAAKLNVPLYPIVAALKGKHYKASVIEQNFRQQVKEDPNKLVNLLTKNMPKQVPNRTKEMKWTGQQFAPCTPYRCPKILNANSLFQTIADHRRVRGADSGRRSLYSKGYYYGYMDSPTAKASYLVADLENLMRSTTGLRYLEINNIDGLFTEIALTSLKANGWVVRVINGHSLPVLDCKDKEKIDPGIYGRVLNCKAPFLVYENIDEKTPTIVKNDVTSRYEVNLPPILERLEGMRNRGDLRIHFTYVYLRDELVKETKSLYPTAHAHAGQAIFCTMEQKDGASLDLHAYMVRTLYANAYKTGFVYYRIPFYQKDQFRFDFKFHMTMKAKLAPSKQWTEDDFEISILEDEIQVVHIDYAALKRCAPKIAAAVAVHSGKASEQEVEEVIEIVEKDDKEREQMRRESDMTYTNSSPPQPEPDDDFDFGAPIEKGKMKQKGRPPGNEFGMEDEENIFTNVDDN